MSTTVYEYSEPNTGKAIVVCESVTGDLEITSLNNDDWQITTFNKDKIGAEAAYSLGQMFVEWSRSTGLLDERQANDANERR